MFSELSRLILGVTQTWLVISGGGTTGVEAELALQRAYQAVHSGELRLRVPDGYPRRVRSDDFAGLKPGFEIVLLGACADEQSAKVARDAARATPGLDGSYVRRTTDRIVPSCPTRLSARPEPVAEPVSLPAVPLVPDSGPLRVRTFKASGLCTAPSVSIEYLRGSTTLDQFELLGECADVQADDGSMVHTHSRTVGPEGSFTTRAGPLLLIEDIREPDGLHGHAEYHAFLGCGDRLQDTVLLRCGFGVFSSCDVGVEVVGEELLVTGVNGCRDKVSRDTCTVFEQTRWRLDSCSLVPKE